MGVYGPAGRCSLPVDYLVGTAVPSRPVVASYLRESDRAPRIVHGQQADVRCAEAHGFVQDLRAPVHCDSGTEQLSGIDFPRGHVIAHMNRPPRDRIGAGTETAAAMASVTITARAVPARRR